MCCGAPGCSRSTAWPQPRVMSDRGAGASLQSRGATRGPPERPHQRQARRGDWLRTFNSSWTPSRSTFVATPLKSRPKAIATRPPSRPSSRWCASDSATPRSSPTSSCRIWSASTAASSPLAKRQSCRVCGGRGGRSVLMPRPSRRASEAAICLRAGKPAGGTARDRQFRPHRRLRHRVRAGIGTRRQRARRRQRRRQLPDGALRAGYGPAQVWRVPD